MRAVFFLIGALRAVVEMIGLCLLGQGVLRVVAGPGRDRNPVYRAFAIVTLPPRCLLRIILPAFVPDRAIAPLTFLFLLFLWLGLAWLRKML